jgi:high-affinity Fe2+/Pb2+ permease
VFRFVFVKWPARFGLAIGRGERPWSLWLGLAVGAAVGSAVGALVAVIGGTTIQRAAMLGSFIGLGTWIAYLLCAWLFIGATWLLDKPLEPFADQDRSRVAGPGPW